MFSYFVWNNFAHRCSQEAAPEKSNAAKKPEDKSGLPPTPLFDKPVQARPTKAEALSRADGLAEGFVLLGLSGQGVEEGWHWVLEGKDEPTVREFTYSIVDGNNLW
jgi:superkiller protein 3